MLLVTTVSPCQALLPLRWRAIDIAEVLASSTMLSPSLDPGRRGRAHARLLVPLEALADVERGLRAGAARRDGAAVRPDEAGLALEDQEVLPDRDRGDAEARGRGRRPEPGPLSTIRRAISSWRSRANTPSGAPAAWAVMDRLRVTRGLRLVAIANTLHRLRAKVKARFEPIAGGPPAMGLRPSPAGVDQDLVALAPDGRPERGIEVREGERCGSRRPRRRRSRPPPARSPRVGVDHAPREAQVQALAARDRGR